MIKEEPPKEVEWPTETDRWNIRLLWKSQGGNAGPIASFGICKRCNSMAYRYGKTYENMSCLDCFTETKRPKKRKKRNR